MILLGRVCACAFWLETNKMAASSHEDVRKETRILIRALPLQVVLALVILVGGLYGGYYHAPDGTIPLPSSGELGTKLTYTLRCFVFLATFLWVAVLLTGLNRTKVGAENPLSGNEAAMELHKKRLKNTLEQTFIFVLMALLLTAMMEREEMKYIFLSMVLFLVGRVLFWVGYGIHPAYRTAGNVVTFGTAFTSFVLSTNLLCSRVLMVGSLLSTTATIVVPALLVLSF